MSDFKAFAKRIRESQFVTLSARPLELFEALPFKISYAAVCIPMAVLTLLRPFVILVRTLNSGYFNFESPPKSLMKIVEGNFQKSEKIVI